MPHFAFGRHRAAEHQHHIVDLLPFPGIGVGLSIGDEARCADEHFIEDAQVVGPERAAGLGDFDNRVGQPRRLHFCRPPAKFHFGFNAVLGQIALGHADRFGGDALAGQVLHAEIAGTFRQ